MLPSPPSCLSCSRLEATATACDGQYPCGTCSQVHTACAYPQPPPYHSIWASRDLRQVESWPESVYLPPGATGSARLQTVQNKQGEVRRIEWQSAAGQQQDLRLRPSISTPTRLIFPPTITGEHEHETAEQVGDRLTFARDPELMDNYTHFAPSDPLPPTLLLNAALAARPPRTSSRITSTFYPWHLNVGNSMTSVDIPAEDGLASRRHAAWRRGDESGRGTAVGWGSFVAPNDEHEELPSASDPSFARRTPILSPLAPPIPSTISPILQLQLAPLRTLSPSTLLTVRTQTELKLLHLGLQSTSPTSLASFTYSGADLGRRPLGDFALGGVCPQLGELGAGMIADVDGGLWGWGLGARGSGRIGDGDWQGGRPNMFRLRRGRKKGEAGYSGFVRVAYGGSRGSDAVVALEDEVLLYDLRSPNASSTLVDLDLLSRRIPFGQVGPSLLTSLVTRSAHSTSPPSGMHVVATTRDVLWVDERMPGKDLLRYAHDRVGKEGKGPDRTLALTEVPSAEQSQRIALHSRNHPLVTIYSYSSSSMVPPRSMLDPYALPSPTRATSDPFVRAGLAFLPLSDLDKFTANGNGTHDSEQSWLVSEVGADGAVFQRACTTAEDVEEEDEDASPTSVVVSMWTEEIEQVKADFASRAAEGVDGGAIGSKEGAETKELNMVKVTQAMQRELRENEENERVLQEKVERAVEMMNRAKEESEQGLRLGDSGVLTVHELLTFAAHEPEAIKEGDDSMDVDEDDIQPASSLPSLPVFPRPSVFPDPLRPSAQTIPLDSSVPALASMVASLSSAAAWTSTPFDLRRGHVESTNQRLAAAPDIPDSFDDMLAQSEALKRRYGADISDAEEGEEQKPSSMHRSMAAACDELVLDMALSAHLSSTRSMDSNPPPPVINAPHPPEQTPPPLHFTHFRPRRHIHGRPLHSDSDSSDDEGEASNWKKPSLKSAGVRALLSEWHIGSNPQSYAWSNPYADEQAKDDPFASQHSQKVDSQSQRKRQREKSSAAPSQSQAAPFSFGFSSSQATPTIASSQPAAQPPQQRTRIPTILEEAPSSPSAPSFAASQPNPFALGPRGSVSFDSQSQRSPGAFGSAASQILPGAFGGREGKKEKDKKKAKKRISGF